MIKKRYKENINSTVTHDIFKIDQQTSNHPKYRLQLRRKGSGGREGEIGIHIHSTYENKRQRNERLLYMLYFFAVKRGERCPGLKDYRTGACLQPQWGGRYPKTRSQWRWRTSPASLHCKGRTSLGSQFHSMLSSTRRTLQDFHQQASKQTWLCMSLAPKSHLLCASGSHSWLTPQVCHPTPQLRSNIQLGWSDSGNSNGSTWNVPILELL